MVIRDLGKLLRERYDYVNCQLKGLLLGVRMMFLISTVFIELPLSNALHGFNYISHTLVLRVLSIFSSFL